MADLAIIIVTWNVRSLVLDALRTVYAELASGNLDAEVYVVDNASSDGTTESIRVDFPTVKVLAQASNLGFAAGNNVAMRALGFRDIATLIPHGPEAVLLLNPDTLVQPRALRPLSEQLSPLPRAGAVGAQLAYADGSFQQCPFGFTGLCQIVIELFPLPRRLYE